MSLDKYINLSSKEYKDSFSTYDDQVRLYPMAPYSDKEVADLDAQIADNPNDAELYLKKGIALSRASLHHQEAINEFSRGLSHNPFHAMLYRWRGHKYINVRQFEQARADLELSSRIDPSNWDTWYHLGLASYLLHDFARAELAYRECLRITKADDSRVAITDWMWMTLMRQGKADQTSGLLDFVTPQTAYGDNLAYFRRLLMYKGLIRPEELMKLDKMTDVDFVTMSYGLGNYYFMHEQKDKAVETWKKALNGKYWSAFGYIASDVDLRALGEL